MRQIDFAPSTIRLLQIYDWPGNVRQLENAILRAILLCEGDMLEPEDFPQIRHEVEGRGLPDDISAAMPQQARTEAPRGVTTLAAPGRATSPAQAVAAHLTPGTMRTVDERGNVRSLVDVEVEMIRFAIEYYNGQMSEVARRLGIGRSTLYRKMKEYGIASDVERMAS